MARETKLERAQKRLAEIRAQQQRQMEHAGLRLGVFARLRELERDERRVLKRIDELTLAAGGAEG
jgi:hypothetical protein